MKNRLKLLAVTAGSFLVEWVAKLDSVTKIHFLLYQAGTVTHF